MLRPDRGAGIWSLAMLGTVILLPRVGAADWEPKKTWVFAIGCMEWKFDHTLNQSKKGRQDEEFLKILKARGVPESQITYLKDRQGTIAAIRRSFVELLRKTKKDDFLIFYFQGHGGRDVKRANSRYYFVNYDANDNDDNSFLYMDHVFDMIDANFKGSHALLTADCCFSGGMIVEARKRKSKIAYACLPSVFAHNGSTGEWTYTLDLVQAFRGDGIMDLNGDGNITLGELASYIEIDMAHMEKQKSTFLTANGFDSGLRISPAKKKSHPDLGKYVEVRSEGKWSLAQVRDFKDDKFQVIWAEYEGNEWVNAKRMRPYKPVQYEAGTKVTAKNEDDKWLPGVVKQGSNGLHLVHFAKDKTATGEWEEWVGPDRIKLPK